MNIYLNHLYSAFKNVDKRYHSWHAYQYSGLNRNIKIDNNDLNVYEQMVERTFAYELYYQYRLIMKTNPENYQDLCLNGEVTKIDWNISILNKKLICPDLVLHKSQMDRSPNYQTLFIEIKTRPNVDFEDDIKKLLYAVSDDLNFQYGVLIYINEPHEKIERKLKRYINELGNIDRNHLERLYLLTYDKYENFNNILK